MAAPGELGWLFDVVPDLFRITVIVLDNTTYSVDILGVDGVTYTAVYVSGPGATLAQICAGISAAINALPSSAGVRAVNNETSVSVYPTVPGTYFSVSSSAPCVGWVFVNMEIASPTRMPETLRAPYLGRMEIIPTRTDGCWWYDLPVTLDNVSLVLEFAYLSAAGWTVSVKNSGGLRIVSGVRILNGAVLFRGVELGLPGVLACMPMSDPTIQPGLRELGVGCRCELIYFGA